ncbi:hemin uptake protein hemP [Palleronia aestuarii]|uniref:Hemin uptake protein hemP n=1 Tax=Palleronia aestuarii TaxID=568105 RepID=A0A2W7N856_9RHOB|nr:hemin uptake protein HemP [Palleronia aestuarii]PZX16210.1 hemin uptake protein hemP [Palleronia aestuarii]
MDVVTPARSEAQATEIPTHSARDLTGADRLARLVLDDKVYVLRITRAGKLILTK